MSTKRSPGYWTRLVFGDRGPVGAALRESGFADEKQAADWAHSLFPAEGMPNEVELTRSIRQARPDIGLKLAAYIARRALARHG